MAIASTNMRGMSKNDNLGGLGGGGGGKGPLDFYESMYHFKKMFPKLDSDVIETILRANNGQVDKTLDQLLTLNVDTELDEVRQREDPAKTTTTTVNTSPIVSEGVIDHDDSPPPYHELIKSSSGSSAAAMAAAASVSFSSQPVMAPIPSQMSVIRSDTSVGDDDNSTQTVPNGLYPFEVRANWRNRAMIGELRRDFLRIRLTNEQLKKFKASIKKAKRDEITALVNETVLERPKLSFELKRQLKEVTGQNDMSDESDEEEASTSSQTTTRQQDELSLIDEEKKKQMELDEYMAKLLQKDMEVRRSTLIDGILDLLTH